MGFFSKIKKIFGSPKPEVEEEQTRELAQPQPEEAPSARVEAEVAPQKPVSGQEQPESIADQEPGAGQPQAGEPVQAPVVDTSPEAVQEAAAREEVAEAAAEPVSEPVATPVAEEVVELVAEVPAAPAAEAAAEPVSEPAAASVAEEVVELVAEAPAEPVAKPVTEAAVEPVSEPAAAPVAEEVVELVAEAPAEPVAKPVAEAAAEPVSEPAATPVAEEVVELVAEAPAEPVAKPVSEAVAAPAAETAAEQPVHKAASSGWLLFEQPAAEPAAEAVAEPVAEAPAAPVAKPAAVAVAEAVAEPVSEPAATPVAEAAAEAVAEQPVQKAASTGWQLFEQPAAEPVAEAAAKPVSEPAAAPVAAEVVELVAEVPAAPVATPAAKAAAEPATEAVVEVVAEAAAEAVAEQPVQKAASSGWQLFEQPAAEIAGQERAPVSAVEAQPAMEAPVAAPVVAVPAAGARPAAEAAESGEEEVVIDLGAPLMPEDWEENRAPARAAAAAAPAVDDKYADLTARLREAEARLPVWLDIVLDGVTEAGPELYERVGFLLRTLEAPQDEADAFVQDFAGWLERMDYRQLDEFRSELQYRLALALDLEDEEDERNRLFLKLSDSLAKTRAQFARHLDGLFASHGELDDDFWEELEEVFIMADLGVEAATALTARLRERARAEKVTTAEGAKELLRKEIRSIFTRPRHIVGVTPPEVVLMIGVNGAGKTTTIAKLAYRDRMQGKKVMIAAGDTFRAAAIDQLQVWAERVGALFHAKKPGSDPASVAYEAMDRAMQEGVDVLYVDTAGRLQTKVNLMDELSKIRNVIARKHPGAPHRTVLVLDATTGQNALSQAKLFKESAGVDELVLTKLDGTAKGGVAIAVAMQHQLPISYVGLGEKIEDLRPFNGDDYADALLQG